MPLFPLSSFIAMGGYGAYVWPAYALALVTLVVLAFLSLRWAKKSERDLAQLRQSLKEDAS